MLVCLDSVHSLEIIERILREVVNRERLCSFTCMLVCWDFICTLEIIERILREVVNRERLCGTSAFYFGCFRNLWGCQTPCRSTNTI